jgi:hypothetical protein
MSNQPLSDRNESGQIMGGKAFYDHLTILN